MLKYRVRSPRARKFRRVLRCNVMDRPAAAAGDPCRGLVTCLAIWLCHLNASPSFDMSLVATFLSLYCLKACPSLLQCSKADAGSKKFNKPSNMPPKKQTTSSSRIISCNYHNSLMYHFTHQSSNIMTLTSANSTQKPSRPAHALDIDLATPNHLRNLHPQPHPGLHYLRTGPRRLLFPHRSHQPRRLRSLHPRLGSDCQTRRNARLAPPLPHRARRQRR